MKKDQKCTKCGKRIDWDEYVVNWSWCSDCLDMSFDMYTIGVSFEKMCGFQIVTEWQ